MTEHATAHVPTRKAYYFRRRVFSYALPAPVEQFSIFSLVSVDDGNPHDTHRMLVG